MKYHLETNIKEVQKTMGKQSRNVKRINKLRKIKRINILLKGGSLDMKFIDKYLSNIDNDSIYPTINTNDDFLSISDIDPTRVNEIGNMVFNPRSEFFIDKDICGPGEIQSLRDIKYQNPLQRFKQTEIKQQPILAVYKSRNSVDEVKKMEETIQLFQNID